MKPIVYYTIYGKFKTLSSKIEHFGNDNTDPYDTHPLLVTIKPKVKLLTKEEFLSNYRMKNNITPI